MKTAIIMGAHSSERVDYFIKLFENQTAKDFTLILVSEKEPEMAFDFDFVWIRELSRAFIPSIRKVRHPIFRNETLVAAVNEGVDYAITWDAYQVPHARLVEEHLKYLQKGYGVCGYRKEIQATYDEYVHGETPMTLRDTSQEDVRNTGIVRFCPGNYKWDCNSSAPIEWYVKVNGWSLDYAGGTAGDDVDLGVRMERAGLRFVYNPNAIMWKTNHLAVKVRYAYQGSECNHPTLKFRSSPWDPATSGDDALMEDEYLRCYYDRHGIKRWMCKHCGAEGLVDSVHVMRYNTEHGITRTDAGFEQVRAFLERGEQFSFV